MLVLTDGEDNISPNPFEVISKALQGSGVSLKMALFQAGTERENAIKQYSGIRKLDPPGDLWEAEQRDELIRNLKEAMQPQILVLRNNLEIVTEIHNATVKGMRALPLRQGFFGWSEKVPHGTYKISTSGIDRTDLLLQTGDRALLEVVVRDGRLAFQPFRYTNYVVPAAYPHLRAQDQRDLVQLALPKMVLQPTERGAYDLELLLMMDRSFRGGSELQMEKPQFAWIEVRPGADKAPITADIENVNYYPAPAWKVRVPNWPSKTNALADAAAPSISAWWLDSFALNAQFETRNKQKYPLLKDDFHKTIQVDKVDVTVESVQFNDKNQLEVQISYPKGKPCPVLVRALDLNNEPRYQQEEEHRFYDENGRYTARFGVVGDKARDSIFSLEFQSMNEIRKTGHRVDLNLNVSPTQNNLIQGPVPYPKTD